MSPFEPTVRQTIHSVLHLLNRNTGITPDAETFLVELIILAIIEPLVHKSILLMEHKRSKTCQSRDLQSAVRAYFPVGLAQQAVSEGTRGITGYQSAKWHQIARTKMFENAVKDMSTDFKTDMKFGRGFWIYFASVLEYIVAEVLEYAYEASLDNTIGVPDIRKGIRDDGELDKLFYPFATMSVDELVLKKKKIEIGQYKKRNQMRQKPRGVQSPANKSKSLSSSSSRSKSRSSRSSRSKSRSSSSSRSKSRPSRSSTSSLSKSRSVSKKGWMNGWF